MSNKTDLFKQATRTLLALFLACTCFPVYAQQEEIDSTVKSRMADTVIQDFVSDTRSFLERKSENNIAKFNSGKLALKQDELIEDIKKTTQNAKNYLKKGIDTAGINSELKNILAWYEIAGDGVFTNKGSAQTYRNLTETRVLLNELLNKAQARKTSIDRFQKDLANFRFRIDSLSADTALYRLPDDSANVTHYLNKLAVAIYEIGPTDSSLKQAIINVQDLQTKLNFVVNKLSFSLEQIELFEQELSNRILSMEFPKLWEPVKFRRPIHEIIVYSMEKGMLVLSFYSENNKGKIIFVLFLIFMLTLAITALKKNLRQAEIIHHDYAEALVFRYPLLSASIIVLNLFQFIFPAPPFIFHAIFWITASVFLTIVFWGYISQYWMRSWLFLFILFLLACVDNLILQVSRVERWAMLGISVPSVIYGSIVLIRGQKHELQVKGVKYFIGLAVLLEVLFIFTDLYGRFNLSKSLFVSGYVNVVIAVLFLYTARLIGNLFAYTYEIYKNPEKELIHLNFENVDKKLPRLFYFFLFIGWFVLFARNFYAFKLISQPLADFITTERTIGNYSFSFSSSLLFCLILAISLITSKIVSYFASYQSHSVQSPSNTGKSGVGSWILLIRIAIVSAGLFLAFAAAGIPMDQITIILGTLGVGIGFGLQSLVNNLISGLIISFEKPVNVGDIVEIAGQSGKVKSIGFRSSVVSTWDGADVIIPNGDLLNAHLINWTLSKSIRRINIVVGVAYGSDLSLVKKTIFELLASNAHVLKYPAPSVVFQEFTNNSIDVKLLFWVQNQSNEWLGIRSDIIASVDTAFKKNGIVIPFQQQDVYLHTPEKDTKIEKEL